MLFETLSAIARKTRCVRFGRHDHVNGKLHCWFPAANTVLRDLEHHVPIDCSGRSLAEEREPEEDEPVDVDEPPATSHDAPSKPPRSAAQQPKEPEPPAEKTEKPDKKRQKPDKPTKPKKDKKDKKGKKRQVDTSSSEESDGSFEPKPGRLTLPACCLTPVLLVWRARKSGLEEGRTVSHSCQMQCCCNAQLRVPLENDSFGWLVAWCRLFRG